MPGVWLEQPPTIAPLNHSIFETSHSFCDHVSDFTLARALESDYNIIDMNIFLKAF